MTRIALVLALGFAATDGAPSLAQETRQSARFDVEIRGLTVGRLDFSAVENANSYAVSGTMQSTGLAGMLRKMKYTASVRGSLTARGFSPQRYEQTGGSGSGYSEEVVVWQGGLPRIERQDPPKVARASDAKPADQRGTVDTLTALYATLRDVAPGGECQSSVIIYDGRYRMQLKLASPRPTNAGGVSCAGEYVRLAGFSPEDMAERTQFPFALHYVPVDGRMRVAEVTMTSLYGSARMVRR